jgi:hypothetical protein
VNTSGRLTIAVPHDSGLLFVEVSRKERCVARLTCQMSAKDLMREARFGRCTNIDMCDRAASFPQQAESLGKI